MQAPNAQGADRPRAAAAAAAAGERPRPLEEGASWLSRLAFHWVTPLIRYGYRNEIKENELNHLPEQDNCVRLADAMEREWHNVKRENRRRWCLARVLWRTLGVQYLMGGAVGLLESFMKIGEAVALGKITAFVQRPNADVTEGYLWAMAMALFSYGHAVTHHHYFHPTMRIGTDARVGFTALIYRKILKLPLASTATAGAIINLVSNDTQSFEFAGPFALYVIIGAVELLLVVWFLYDAMGVACFAGLATFLLLFPLQYTFARSFAGTRHSTVHRRDERVRSLADLILGIELVKLYAWEKPLGRTVQALRNSEFKPLLKASMLKAMNDSIFFFFPALVSFVTFMTKWAMGEPLVTANVFMSLALFRMLQLTLTNFLPKGVETISECRVSLGRIERFLELPELESSTARHSMPLKKEHVVEFDSASFAWTAGAGAATQPDPDGKESRPDLSGADASAPMGLPSTEELVAEKAGNEEQKKAILRNVTLSVGTSELVAVVGKVGAGKTSLAMALLGEMGIVEGSLRMGRAGAGGDAAGCCVEQRQLRVAYASQSPWIIAGSVRENILLGREFDKRRYDTVISACSLERDMQLWPDGEHTIIGERGVNISGGQKARIGLARTVYGKDVDLYILDDPLSAVDSRVGRRLFQDCIKSFLAGKARILVTHQLQFLRECDQVAVLDKGVVAAHCRPGDFGGGQGAGLEGFSDILKEFLVVEGEEPEGKQEGEELVSSSSSLGNGVRRLGDATEGQPPLGGLIEDAEAKDDENDAAPAGVNPNAELRQSGSVRLAVYLRYLRSGMPAYGIPYLAVVFLVAQCASVGADYWLSSWSAQPPGAQRGDLYPTVYSILVASTIFFAFARTVSVYITCLNCSKNLFKSMLASALRAPITFFHQNPHGRVLNRFTKDQSIADELIPWLFQDGVTCMLQSVGCVVVVCAVIPPVLAAIPVLLLAFFFCRRCYMRTSRQVKRLESTTRSPVYSFLSETLDGLATVRAYDAVARFNGIFSEAVNQNTRAYYLFLGSARWLGIRIDVLAATFLSVTTFLTVTFRQSIAPNLVALSLAYVLQLIGLVQWSIRMSIEIEINMIAIERMLEYTRLPPEAPEVTDLRPDRDWPRRGVIEFRNASLAYPGREDKPVLKGINMKVEAHEKIGIVGRTGAGKSSMLNALFRMVEPTPAGSIVIDDVDISKLGLADLRSKVAIIPQEPFLFKGTIRYNLDPFGVHSDHELWEALGQAELKAAVEKLAGGLDAPVTEGGKNISIGERQLVCLARAILRRTSIVVLDEATANVDLHTDRLIQSAARTQFKDATVLTIAHRLDTVMMCDKVLVLDAGQVAEYGPPHELLQNESGVFSRMVADTGPDTEKLLRRVAAEAYQASASEERRRAVA